MSKTPSEFKAVFSDTVWSDKMYRFLQNIFHLYPEDKFHYLLKAVTEENDTDEYIYKAAQAKLPAIKPFLSAFTYALPSLKKQKKEMSRQMMLLLKGKSRIDGYLEIGSTGRYISDLRKSINVRGPIYLTNDIAPSNSVADFFERGQIRPIGKFFLNVHYAPITPQQITDESVDLVTCNIGLHHSSNDALDGYINSIHRVLRKDGIFIMRDHDVKTPEMATFVSLVHTVFNIGLNETWETEMKDHKSFRSVAEWVGIVSKHGFTDTGERILQDNDPSDNTLLSFIKT